MQKAGTWTWAAFLDICKKLTRDTNNDGKMDTYAMTADLSTEILDAIVSSNGATYVDKDPKTGKFVNASNRPEFLAISTVWIAAIFPGKCGGMTGNLPSL